MSEINKRSTNKPIANICILITLSSLKKKKKNILLTQETRELSGSKTKKKRPENYHLFFFKTKENYHL